jgi:hypothetical protein
MLLYINFKKLKFFFSNCVKQLQLLYNYSKFIDQFFFFLVY